MVVTAETLWLAPKNKPVTQVQVNNLSTDVVRQHVKLAKHEPFGVCVTSSESVPFLLLAVAPQPKLT